MQTVDGKRWLTTHGAQEGDMYYVGSTEVPVLGKSKRNYVDASRDFANKARQYLDNGGVLSPSTSDLVPTTPGPDFVRIDD